MLNFVVFHTGRDTLDRYKPLMAIGRRALAKTNPGAQYIVLTDRATVDGLLDFECVVCAPDNTPLMQQFMLAQLEYCKIISGWNGMSVLAGTDCVATKYLPAKVDPAHTLAITYRFGSGHNINNVAYVRDHAKMAWFLERALGLMDPKLAHFYGRPAGDQQAWEAALGPVNNWLPVVAGGEETSTVIRTVFVEGRQFWLYPCKTHNNAPKRSGAWGASAERACLVHYKGTRKDKMVESIKWFVFRESDLPGNHQPRWGKE